MTRINLGVRILGLFVLLASALFGQASVQFQGSVPTGTLSAEPLALTLEAAIQRGLQTNLGLLTRDTTSRTVLAERTRALSALLPQVTGTLGETVQQTNLQTLRDQLQVPPHSGLLGDTFDCGTFLIHRRASHRVGQGLRLECEEEPQLGQSQ